LVGAAMLLSVLPITHFIGAEPEQHADRHYSVDQAYVPPKL
jgi:hypothetical protein